nr:ATP-dependent DNA helicase [bacterium]
MAVERISVHRLLALALDAGSLGPMASGGRMQLGVEIHRALQAAAPPNAVCELALRRRYPQDDPVIEVSGRIDCTYVTPDGMRVVEEFKSVSSLPDNPPAAFFAQALLYAWMLGEEGLQTVSVLCVDSQSGETARFDHQLTLAEITARVEPILSRAARRRTAARYRYEAMVQSIASLPLPYDSLRPGQDEMVSACFSALAEEETLLVEAPTGIGKTMGALYPATLRLGQRGAPSRIFYATAKSTARKAAIQALLHLQSLGLDAAFVELTARERCCPYPDAGCDPALCPRALDYYARSGPALERALEQGRAFDRATISRICKQENICPFEFALDLTDGCAFVLGDLNYCFSPHVQLQRMFGPQVTKARRPILLQDEAHNLLGRAREMFSATVEKSRILSARQLALSLPGYEACAEALGRLNALFVRKKREMEQAHRTLMDAAELETALHKRLEAATAAAEALLAVPLEAELADAMRKLFFSLRAASDACAHFDQGYRLWWDITQDVVLHLYCADPSSRLGQVLERTRGAVLFSATLSPLPYFMRLLAPGARALELPSPFPQENLRVLLDATIRTTFRSRAEDYQRVARQLEALVSGKSGNYLAFFPSFAYLNGVRPFLQGMQLIVQSPGMPERERRAFLRAFSAPPAPDAPALLGLAVMGGVFSEGVDLAGEKLVGVAVVGVGWPQLTPEREMLRLVFDDEEGQGQRYAYIHPGIHRVLQAAGRLIRTENDRGVLLLMDERFTQPPFCQLLPDTWHITPTSGPQDTARLAADFWLEG